MHIHVDTLYRSRGAEKWTMFRVEVKFNLQFFERQSSLTNLLNLHQPVKSVVLDDKLFHKLTILLYAYFKRLTLLVLGLKLRCLSVTYRYLWQRTFAFDPSPWTFYVYRLSCGQTLCQMWAKLNNPRLSYSDLKNFIGLFISGVGWAISQSRVLSVLWTELYQIWTINSTIIGTSNAYFNFHC